MGEDGGLPVVVSGKVVAPAIGAVICDTGPLTVGVYDVDFDLAVEDTALAGKGAEVEHRNAANSATVRNLGATPAGTSIASGQRRYSLAEGERIRVVCGSVAGAAGSVFIANLTYRNSD